MRFFVFWLPLLIAGAILSLAAVSSGIPAKTLGGAWASNIVSACAKNRDKCLSVSIREQADSFFDKKIVFVKAPRGAEAAGLALMDAQSTEFQKHFVTVLADPSRAGEKR